MNIPETFYNTLRDLVYDGEEIVVRGMKTKEFIQEHFFINKPLERCIVLPHRNDNVFAKIAETMWMLAGRNDIEWLSWYLPRAKDFSDDGRTWRGAYGPRIRLWQGEDDEGEFEQDQLAYVVDLLSKDPTSRQAVISIWDPSIDTDPGLDIPCNLNLQFLIRDGKLYMNITQRSSDWMWGFSGIDSFSWSVLLQMMSYWLGVEPGNISWFIGSLHIYERHWETANRILNSYRGTLYDYVLKTPDFCVKFEQFDEFLKQFFILEDDSRKGKFVELASPMCYDPWFKACYTMLAIYNMYKLIPMMDTASLSAYIDWIPDCDMKLAAIEYFLRERPDLVNYIDVHDKIMLSQIGIVHD